MIVSHLTFSSAEVTGDDEEQVEEGDKDLEEDVADEELECLTINSGEKCLHLPLMQLKNW